MYIIVVGCTGAIWHMADDKMYCVYGKIDGTDEITAIMRTPTIGYAKLFNLMSINFDLALKNAAIGMDQVKTNIYNDYFRCMIAEAATMFNIHEHFSGLPHIKEPKYKYALYERIFSDKKLVAEFVNKCDAIHFMIYLVSYSHSLSMSGYVIPDKNDVPPNVNPIEMMNITRYIGWANKYFIEEMD